MKTILLPLFPLQIVVFETEVLRLHIFEPRYKRLILECFETQAFFGIPLLNKGKFEGSGCQLGIDSIEKTHENGEMDIICIANQRFNLKELFAAKDYQSTAFGVVEFVPFVKNEDKELNVRITDLLNALIHLNHIEIPLLEADDFNFYAWIHKCGLTLLKEIEMVHLPSTHERQLYLVEHLKLLFNSTEESMQMKKVIQLNGHFKKLNQSF